MILRRITTGNSGRPGCGYALPFPRSDFLWCFAGAGCRNSFGVGNENWGCGGNMTPDYYAHLYRRYQTYVRCYDKNAPVFKICGGANADDYEWTDVVLRECFRSPAPPQAHGFMDGLSVHYYVGVEKGEHKGSATEFDEARWFDTLSHAVKMEELINRHGAIMDRYDPEKKIGMIVDEWGCWHDVEPGTNPGFLYQQHTMRDALTAGITLNIFNRHCDRVKMACIAQMVNVPSGRDSDGRAEDGKNAHLVCLPTCPDIIRALSRSRAFWREWKRSACRKRRWFRTCRNPSPWMRKA